MEGKDVHPIPPYGEIAYADNGDCICPFCGKAFRKLGRHFNLAHGLTSKQAHEKLVGIIMLRLVIKLIGN
jgi:uncharacterized C2H2 Zn-finger protein